MELGAVVVPGWPPLAWLAVCDPAAQAITVHVGAGVEVHDEWICEGVWDGEFAEGGFDRTDLVFGSGVRRRDDVAWFVSAGSTVDRLHSLEIDGVVYVSNSFPGLLAWVDGSLDLSVTSYTGVFRSITDGLDRYQRTVPTTAGPVRLTYFHNLCWDGRSLREVPKPDPDRDFSTFERYRSFLSETMRALAHNARSTDRERPLELLATLSSGYDSATSSVLARAAGCTEAFGFDRARGDHDDSGEPVAEALGLRYHPVETTAWEKVPMAAVPFLAAVTSGGSSVPFRGAEHLLKDRVVLTGFHGDKMWDPATTKLGRDIVRGDASGTDLSEYRLWAGFVDCPVPYWGVRQIADVHALGHAPEQAPWDVGGGYTRPVCRRIVEEAGVPRGLFGVRKKATAQRLLMPGRFLTPDMRLDYLRWLRAQPSGSIDVPAAAPDGRGGVRTRLEASVGALAGALRANRAVRRLGPAVDRALERLEVRAGTDHRVHRYVFHWAVERAKERYQVPGRAAGQVRKRDAKARRRAGRKHSSTYA